MKTAFLVSFAFLSVTFCSATEIPKWEITAKSSSYKKDQAIFTGEVKVVKKGEFELICDELKISLTADGHSSSWTALGKIITFKRKTQKGILQIVKAKKAVSDSKSGNIIFSGGPPFMQSGSTYINTTGTDNRIELSANGKYTVSSDTRRVTIVPPPHR